MHTEKDAIQIAQAVIRGYRAEFDNQYKPVGTPVDWAMRGTVYRILQDLWYDTFSSNLRSKFDYIYENWLEAAGVKDW